MKIDCLSDMHGYFPILDGGDLLLLAGDYCYNNRYNHFLEFMDWLIRQD